MSGFKWPKEGIFITPLLQNLYVANFPKLLKCIYEDLQRWSAVPLSLLGRVQCVRMNILPRLLYPFQMLPIEIPNNVFAKLEKQISTFIWAGQRPIIKYKTLQLMKTDGGVCLPNFKYYYWEAQLKPTETWLKDNTDTRWLNIQKSLCQYPLTSLPFVRANADKMVLGKWKKNYFTNME